MAGLSRQPSSAASALVLLCLSSSCGLSCCAVECTDLGSCLNEEVNNWHEEQLATLQKWREEQLAPYVSQLTKKITESCRKKAKGGERTVRLDWLALIWCLDPWPLEETFGEPEGMDSGEDCDDILWGSDTSSYLPKVAEQVLDNFDPFVKGVLLALHADDVGKMSAFTKYKVTAKQVVEVLVKAAEESVRALGSVNVSTDDDFSLSVSW